MLTELSIFEKTMRKESDRRKIAKCPQTGVNNSLESQGKIQDEVFCHASCSEGSSAEWSLAGTKKTDFKCNPNINPKLDRTVNTNA